MHSQSATVIDAYHPLGLTNTTSIISDGKPFTLCQVKPANLSSKLLSMKMFKERNSRVNGPIFKFEDL
jgi:hypothetical protein